MPLPSSLVSRVPSLVAAALAACSPTFNWREVPVGDAGVVALLPCKPDRATRADAARHRGGAVDMAGCEAGGATFAVAHASAGSAGAGRELDARLARGDAQPAGGRPGRRERRPPCPAPRHRQRRCGSIRRRPRAESRRPRRPTCLWFAQQRPDGMAIYQATVLGTPSSPTRWRRSSKDCAFRESRNGDGTDVALVGCCVLSYFYIRGRPRIIGRPPADSA